MAQRIDVVPYCFINKASMGVILGLLHIVHRFLMEVYDTHMSYISDSGFISGVLTLLFVESHFSHG